MAGFGLSVITDVGRAALMRVLTDESELVFSRIALGDGQMDSLLAEKELQSLERKQTELLSEKWSIPVTEKRLSTPEIVTLGGVFNNVELVEGFAWAEIGLYCVDPEDPEQEILYSYNNAQSATKWMPSFNGSVAVTEYIRLNAYIGALQSVSFSMPTDGYATIGSFEQLESEQQETKANLQGQIDSLLARLQSVSDRAFHTHLDDLVVDLEVTNEGTDTGGRFKVGDTVHYEGLISNPTEQPIDGVRLSLVSGTGALAYTTTYDQIDGGDVQEFSADYIPTDADLAHGLSMRAVLEHASPLVVTDLAEQTPPIVIEIEDTTAKGIYSLGDVIETTITLTNHSHRDYHNLTVTVTPGIWEVHA